MALLPTVQLLLLYKPAEAIWLCCLQFSYCCCKYTVPKEIDFPRYNMKCSWENVILRGIFHVVSSFPLHFILYRGNFDSFLDSVPHMLTINLGKYGIFGSSLRPEHCVVHALLKISKSHITDFSSSSSLKMYFGKKLDLVFRL